ILHHFRCIGSALAPRNTAPTPAIRCAECAPLSRFWPENRFNTVKNSAYIKPVTESDVSPFFACRAFGSLHGPISLELRTSLVPRGGRLPAKHFDPQQIERPAMR